MRGGGHDDDVGWNFFRESEKIARGGCTLVLGVSISFFLFYFLVVFVSGQR